MSRRIVAGVSRGRPIRLRIDDSAMTGYIGETVATVMVAADVVAFRSAGAGRPQGMFCNMGTCSACFVAIRSAGSTTVRRLRACLVPAADGMVVHTESSVDG